MSEDVKPVIFITVKEFRMWLEGVEEMQADGWVPDARQWQRIRDKINTVSTASTPVSVTTTGSGGGGNAPVRPNAPMYDVPPVVYPAGPSLLSGAVNMNRQAPAAPETVNPLFSTSSMPMMPGRTPDVDTSNGKQYESSFA
jgi:hypothetical protein